MMSATESVGAPGRIRNKTFESANRCETGHVAETRGIDTRLTSRAVCVPEQGTDKSSSSASGEETRNKGFRNTEASIGGRDKVGAISPEVATGAESQQGSGASLQVPACNGGEGDRSFLPDRQRIR